MRKEYPHYKHGELDRAEKKLVPKDKETLKLFLEKCSITAGEKKVKHIKKLLIQLADVTRLPLTEQTKESINSFLALLSQSNKSYWTKDEIRVYVKQFLLWYYKDLEMVENIKPESKKGLNPQKITENNLLTEKDVEQMVRFADSYKDKAYLLLAFQTGARPQELLGLRWKDIVFTEKYADVTLYSGKTGQSRAFPIVKETMKALWEWKEHYAYADVSPKDYVFVSRWRDRPMTTAGLNKMLRKMAKASGIGKDVWTYLIRHTRATRLYEELPQQIVEKLMGHKNMAGVYAHISSKKAREEMLNKIYNIEELTQEDKEEIKKLKEIILTFADIVQTNDPTAKEKLQRIKLLLK
jgi:integrase